MFRKHAFFFAALVALTLAGAARAEGPRSAAVDVSGRIWLEGDSTLHKYKLDALAYSAVVEPAPEANGTVETWLDDGRIRSLTLRIAVAKLHSAEAGLDENLRKTLHAAEHPEIVFRVDTVAPVAGQADRVKLQGTLEVASGESGTRLTLRVPLTAAAQPNTLISG